MEFSYSSPHAHARWYGAHSCTAAAVVKQRVGVGVGGVNAFIQGLERKRPLALRKWRLRQGTAECRVCATLVPITETSPVPSLLRRPTLFSTSKTGNTRLLKTWRSSGVPAGWECGSGDVVISLPLPPLRGHPGPFVFTTKRERYQTAARALPRFRPNVLFTRCCHTHTHTHHGLEVCLV